MWAQSPAEIGKVIATARRHRKLTQSQLASATGVTQTWISQVEQGKDNAQIGKVLRLLSYLGVRPRVGAAPWLSREARDAHTSAVPLSEVIDAHTRPPRPKRTP